MLDLSQCYKIPRSNPIIGFFITYIFFNAIRLVSASYLSRLYGMDQQVVLLYDIGLKTPQQPSNNIPQQHEGKLRPVWFRLYCYQYYLFNMYK